MNRFHWTYLCCALALAACKENKDGDTTAARTGETRPPAIAPATAPAPLALTIADAHIGGIAAEPTISGGKPPYALRIVTGQATVDRGRVVALARGVVLVEATDAERRTARLMLDFYARLAATVGVPAGRVLQDPDSLVLSPGESVPFLAHGGVAPYTFTLGSPPAGATIDASTGIVRTGTGEGLPEVTVTDAVGNRARHPVRVQAEPGMRDFSFGTNGLARLPNPSFLRLALDREDRILAAGYSERSYGDSRRILLVRYRKDGALDDSFGVGGNARIEETGRGFWLDRIAVDNEDRTIVLAHLSGGEQTEFRVYRFTATGALDVAFGEGGTVVLTNAISHSDSALVTDSRGRILIAGELAENGGAAFFGVQRLLPNGRSDADFGQRGIARLPFRSGSMALAVQASPSRILVAGSAPDRKIALVALTERGQRDATFAADGLRTLTIPYYRRDPHFTTVRYSAQSILPLADGDLVVACIAAGAPVLVTVPAAASDEPRYDVTAERLETSVWDLRAVALADGGVLLQERRSWSEREATVSRFQVKPFLGLESSHGFRQRASEIRVPVPTRDADALFPWWTRNPSSDLVVQSNGKVVVFAHGQLLRMHGPAAPAPAAK